MGPDTVHGGLWQIQWVTEMKQSKGRKRKDQEMTPGGKRRAQKREE